MPRDERDLEGGFTLIELAITVVIMTIVLGALAMGVVTLLRTTGVTTDRLVGSHDAQLLTEWITTDIQSAASAPDLQPGTPPGCADDGSLLDGVNVAQMTWTDRSTGFVYHAAYRSEQVRAGSPPAFNLMRYFCQEGAGHPTTRFPVVRGLKDGSVCPPGGVPSSNAACGVFTPPSPESPSPRFDLQIVSVAGNQSYTFIATATGRTATSGTDTIGPQVKCVNPPPGPCDRWPIVAYNTDDSGNAGLVNRVVVTFDEALKTNDSLPVGAWTLHNAPNGVTVTAVAAANHTVTLTLANGTGSPVTDVGGFNVDMQALNGVLDGLGNEALPFAGKSVDDGMAPIIQSATTGDASTPPDQTVDQVTLTMSEAIDSNPLVPANKLFVVTPPASWVQVAFNVLVATKNGTNTVVLSLQSVGGQPPPPDTTASGLTVTVKADPNGVRDPTHNFGGSTQTVDDGIGPELLAIKSVDADSDGRLDHIVADFSENLQPSTDTGLWHLSRPTGWSSTPRINNVSVTGSQVTLTVNPATVPSAPDTAAAGMTATLDRSATTGIRDALGNPATFSGTSVTDGMAPVLSLSFPNRGSTSGQFETGDSLVATFSEPLSTPPNGTVTVTLDRPAGKPNATITIPGLTKPSVDLGTGQYFNAANNTAMWQATVVRSGASVTVTLSGPCAGAGCANLTTAPTAPMTLNVSPNLVDAAGNVALDAPLNIQWF